MDVDDDRTIKLEEFRHFIQTSMGFTAQVNAGVDTSTEPLAVEDEPESRFEDVQPERLVSGEEPARNCPKLHGLVATKTDAMVGCDICAQVLAVGNVVRSCQVQFRWSIL